MAFQLSPGVLVTEKDLTSVVPAVGTSIGGTVISSAWGPANEISTISSENELVQFYGKPEASDNEKWFAASSFLAYNATLKVIRGVNTATALNSTAAGGGLLIENSTDYVNNHSSAGDAQGMWAAKYPGDTGDSLLVSFADSTTFADFALAGTITTTTSSPTVTGVTTAFDTEAHVGGVLKDNAGAVIGTVLTIDSATVITLTANALVATAGGASNVMDWAYKDQFDYAPTVSDDVSLAGGSGDEMHVIVVDKGGLFSGAGGNTLEKFPGLSKSSASKDSYGQSKYYVTAINDRSAYVWHLDHPAANTNWGGINSVTYGTVQVGTETSVALTGGSNVAATVPADGDLISGYTLFANDELVDINLIFTGNASATVQNHVIDNVTSVRKDCLAFLSPQYASVINVTDGTEAANIVAEVNTRSSFAVKDSGWKYMYNRYDDRYVWVPCNGDTAGICAATDRDADPWFSPAGYNRGQIKNAVKLGYSPNLADRDTLYKAGVNPIVGFPGAGIVLYGDKTLLDKPSAFDRINVRRLFITLEKAIATAAKFQLFEFNDAFTRAQFRNLVEPFLRDVQGRRGVVDFRVVCDETNNTSQVIDTNSFVADIFIQPSRSINFIQLNFIATRSGISFNEIGV